jgi:purine-binding chemotaxis protein CheW
MNERQRFCTFYLEPYFFGVEVEAVQEVLVGQDITRVPLAHRSVSGVINLRGQIVTVIDLRSRLEMADRESAVDPTFIVTNAMGEPVSFLVDRADDVVEVNTEDFEPTPRTVRGVAHELIKGALALPDRLLLVLDPDSLADLEGVVR